VTLGLLGRAVKFIYDTVNIHKQNPNEMENLAEQMFLDVSAIP
jgi:hypothetical protein